VPGAEGYYSVARFFAELTVLGLLGPSAGGWQSQWRLCAHIGQARDTVGGGILNFARNDAISGIEKKERLG
jgi:hypothetical protein